MPKLKTVILIQLANCLPLLEILGLILVLVKVQCPWSSAVGLCAAWIYLLPPVFYRLWIWVRSKPEGQFDIDSKEYMTWWVGVQLQALFLRFDFLEEVLRVVPMAYSGWLRLWGANIGKAVYWSPKSLVLDRGHLQIGDFVVVGVGARMASHLVDMKESGGFELILQKPQVGSYSILGGYSGVGPGSIVAERETLPAHFLLAPNYRWSEGKRHAPERSSV